MDCAEEVAVLKREVGPVAGGPDNLTFDLLNGKMTVLSATDVNGIVKAVGRTGMRAERWETDAPNATRDTFWQRRGRTMLTAVSGMLAIADFLLHLVIAGSVLAALGSEGMGLSAAVPMSVRALYSLAVIAGAWYVVPKAWYSLVRLRPDMNLLMTMAAIGAAALGEWFEAAVVAFLFALSLTLESWSLGRARRAVEALMAIAPPTVRRRKADGSTEEVPPGDVLVGETFSVLPGERIALDGTIVRGASEVNQAPITGESLPVSKEPGLPVFAGTINGNGALEIEATKLAGETTLAQIIRMVGEAQSRRAPSEQWVDKFARFYTPAVLALSLLLALVPPLVLGSGGGDWLYRALVLLVIGCPCALVISTPVSIVAGLAASAKNGVLIKGGLHLESPAHLKAIALDKTGTLSVLSH
jgi:Zn2+/Cd2+-exporting ATPase